MPADSEDLKKAREAHARGEYAEANRLCDKVLSTTERNPAAWLIKAHSLFMIGDFESSLQASERGEAVSGIRDKELLELIAAADKINIGRIPEELEEELKTLETSESRQVRLRAHVLLVAYYLTHKDWEKALDEYKQVELDNPSEATKVISSLLKRIDNANASKS